ncbi:Adenylate kinase [Hondaea fermentalgiana]|uniref:Adenylate kinase n=1 Tax=Hondaea fermentalgiana TaxID=2315210 RepID=A0A2R5GSX7_9STRA|nr:Adenylate kinase [Hondaea fermentalgiana]|eukprot:GBG30984.1 Adenylate kinase [Hondaea fermentalgiana]
MAKVQSVQYLDGEEEVETAVTRGGRAKVVFTNGDEFEGDFGEDLLKAEGVYRFASGARYEGAYAKGVKEGQGLYTYPNGDTFEGTWVGGKKNGPGVEVFGNGDKFEGAWADDMRDGDGVYTYASGAKLSGTWRHGEIVDAAWEHGSKRMSARSVLRKLNKHVSKRFSRRGAAAEAQDQEQDQDQDQDDNVGPLGVIISGAPASGKGTQCEYIREAFGLVHLSTGDMLRAAVAAGTELGKKAKALMESGQLVPDDVVIGAVKERLAQDDVQQNGFLLDGFPRTAAQAAALDELGVNVHIFIILNVPDEALVARVVGRRIDPETGNSYHVEFNPPPPEIEERVVQRADDTEEKVKVRVKAFHKNIDSIRAFYEAVTVEVDGMQTKDEVWADVEMALAAARDDLAVALQDAE